MTLPEKLKIVVERSSQPFSFDAQNPIVALYNPNELSVVKSVTWRSMPSAENDVGALQFTHGEPATLTVNLLFDTYEAREDVRRYTRRVADLTTVATHGALHRPPICQLTWGRQEQFFQGVLQNLTQRFTLFLGDGTAVRATLTCVFQQWVSRDDEQRQQGRQSVDVTKTRTVKRGDTLSSLAGEEYHDPSLWRPIAEANHLDDPRTLTPGQVLMIPSLTPGESRGGSGACPRPIRSYRNIACWSTAARCRRPRPPTRCR